MTITSPIEPGIYRNVPDAEYRKAPGVSQSSLKPMDKSYAHYLDALANPAEPTKAMIIGRICHQLALTPSEPAFWVVKPEGHDGRTSEGKAWAKENASVEHHLTVKEWSNIRGAVEAALTHEAISLALDGAELELSVFARDVTGIMRKGRMDICPPGPSLADLKFVEDASESAFEKQMDDMLWYRQASYYLDLYNANLPDGKEPKTKFFFFAIEKTPPHGINCWEMDPADIQRGRLEYQRFLQVIADHQNNPDATKIYHSGSAYHAGIRPIKLPKWARKRIDQSFVTI